MLMFCVLQKKCMPEKLSIEVVRCVCAKPASGRDGKAFSRKTIKWNKSIRYESSARALFGRVVMFKGTVLFLGIGLLLSFIFVVSFE